MNWNLGEILFKPEQPCSRVLCLTIEPLPQGLCQGRGCRDGDRGVAWSEFRWPGLGSHWMWGTLGGKS